MAVYLTHGYVYKASSHYRNVDMYFEEPVTVIISDGNITFKSQWGDEFSDYYFIPEIEEHLKNANFFASLSNDDTVTFKCSRDEYPNIFKVMVAYVEYDGDIYLSQGVGMNYIDSYVDSVIAEFYDWYLPLLFSLISFSIVYTLASIILERKLYKVAKED